MPKSERRFLPPNSYSPDDTPPPLHPSDVYFRSMMPVSLLWAILAILGSVDMGGWPTAIGRSRGFWRAARSHQPAARLDRHARTKRRECRAR